MNAPDRAHTAVADAAAASVGGQLDAQKLLVAIRTGHAPADMLLSAIGEASAVEHPEHLRGFVRVLQKVLERTT